MKRKNKTVTILLSLLLCTLVLVGNSFSAKPVTTIKQKETKIAIPSPRLEEVEEAILPSPVDSLSKSAGIEAEGQTDDLIKPVEIRTRKAHEHRPDDLKFEDPSKTNKKGKEQK